MSEAENPALAKPFREQTGYVKSPLSTQNRDLLEKKLGRKLPVGDVKVTLMLSGLGQLLDAARDQRGKPVADPDWQAALDAVFGKVP